jgi:hypothetical protein
MENARARNGLSINVVLPPLSILEHGDGSVLVTDSK